jgi:hypothetical protein
MQKAIQVGKAAVLFSLSVCLLAITLFFMQARQTTLHTQRSLDHLTTTAETTLDGIAAPCPVLPRADKPCGLIARANAAINAVNMDAIAANGLLVASTGTTNRLNRTLDVVDQPCVPGPCGTLADVAKTLNTVRGTSGQVEILFNHEDKNLHTLDAQEAVFFTDVHGTLTDANNLLTSPSVTNTLLNFDATSKSIADGTMQADATLTDVRLFADKLTHPPKKKLTFWTATEAGGDYAKHFMPPLF